ncbi:diacylglycerol kinase family protein [Leifsonia sp. Root112D2]|uniref:diacylglycerol kinase family protein n=1 Tax=Leifsonia sp. Root112D2 TaxID=1736426 RepID=UPI0009E9C64D|nr:diacylglycerol kinase family protein [Leifsonia sp. Root112D2]
MSAAPSRVVVAINPTAAFGKHLAVGAGVVDAVAAAGYEAVAVSAANFELLRRETEAALRDDDRALVVVGGDGMVSMGVNLVATTSVPLGIVATGTGNDTARSLGLPHDDTDAAVRALVTMLSRPPRVIDAGRVRHGELTTWFAGAVSAGFDAIVNDRANHMSWPRGASRYTLALLREMLTLKPIEYRLVVDGVPRTERALLISVANGNSIGGGMRIVPQARLDDGLLDLFLVSPMRRLAFLRVFPKVFSGTHTELDEVHISRVRSVRIDADDIVAMADGERIGALPIDIDIVPGALRVLAPLAAPLASETTPRPRSAGRTEGAGPSTV